MRNLRHVLSFLFAIAMMCVLSTDARAVSDPTTSLIELSDAPAASEPATEGDQGEAVSEETGEDASGAEEGTPVASDEVEPGDDATADASDSDEAH